MSGYETTWNQEIEPIEEIDRPMGECGVFAVWAPGYDVATMTYHGLKGLQHRGESAAGIMVADPDFGIWGHKGTGLVDAAIPEAKPNRDGVSPMDIVSASPLAVGHVRYSTAASNSKEAAQPFKGLHISLSMNGHIEGLDEVGYMFGMDVTDGITDTYKLTSIVDARTGKLGDVEEALKEVLPHVNGAYCLTITDGKRMIGVRDPWGFHPLALGAVGNGSGFVLSSESVALASVGAEHIRDIQPGEIVIAGPDGVKFSSIDREVEPRRCSYEYIYKARSDGELDGVPVHEVRSRLGQYLAEDYPVKADVVIGMPASGMPAAFAYSKQSGIPIVDGVVKNAYAGRSFLQRGNDRAATLVDKARVIPSQVAGRDIIIVDDSAIKGNSLLANIKLFRAAGAGKIHVRIAAPPYLYPCYMGMDTGNPEELIARRMPVEDMAEYFGVDSIAFISPERVQQAADDVAEENRRNLGTLCMACSTGEYPFDVSDRKAVVIGMPTVRKQSKLPLAGF
jgi:amidophosphoribosyltransferase